MGWTDHRNAVCVCLPLPFIQNDEGNATHVMQLGV